MEKLKRIEAVQKLIKQFGRVSYKGVYLWKYIEYEALSAVTNYQDNNRNIAVTIVSDENPLPTQQELQETIKNMEDLEENDILAVLAPLRRIYKGKLEHTAMEAYLEALEPESYTVLEAEYQTQKEELIPTQNRKKFYVNAVSVIEEKYETNKEEIMRFLLENYIKPLERGLGIKYPNDILLQCVYKVSRVMKYRQSFMTYYMEILRKVNPKVIIYTHGADMLLCYLREAAQSMGIPTAEIAHGACIPLMSYSSQLQYADYFLVQSDIIEKGMREVGWDNVYTVGKPYIYEKALEVPVLEESPIILGVISSLEKELFGCIYELAARLDKKKYLILFKPHSSEKWDEQEKDRMEQALGNIQFISSQIDIREILEVSDIIIGSRSSGVLDALPYPKKKLIAVEDKYREEEIRSSFSFWDILCEQGDMVKVAGSEELEQEVKSYERGIYYRKYGNHFWPKDGTEQFRKFLQQFLDGRRPEEEEKKEKRSRKIKILQDLLKNKFSKCSYQGVYLWKYLEYDMVVASGEYQNFELNSAVKVCEFTVPMVSEERLIKARKLLEGLEQKDILAFMLPLRRVYCNKLYHTAMDPYLEVLDPGQYTALEVNSYKLDASLISTKNRLEIDNGSIVGMYGEDLVNKDEVKIFLKEQYIEPLEKEMGIVFRDELVMRYASKATYILKIRKAYIACFREVLQKVKPKVVIYSHGADQIACFMREAAQMEGIPTIEIAHGEVCQTMIYPKVLKYADYFLVHSDILEQEMRLEGWKDVYSVGKPYIYESAKQLDLPSDKPVIISVISSLEIDLFVQIKELARCLIGSRYIIMFKTHSSEYWSEEEKEEITNCFENWMFIDENMDIREMAEMSDIIVGMRSSALLEVLPYYKKKIIILEDRYQNETLIENFSFRDKICQVKELVKVCGVSELEQEIRAYRRGEKYRGEVNHYWPTGAEKRFQRFIQIILDGKKPEEEWK